MAHWPDRSEVGSIACLMLGEIGDLLVTTPTLSALKARYPDASLELIIRTPMADLVREHPAVDRLFLYDNRSVLHKVGYLARLAMRRWDLWVDLHTPTFNTWCTNSHVFRRNALMMRMPRTRFRLGFAMAETAPYLTHAVEVPGSEVLTTENIVDTTLRLAPPVSGNTPSKAMCVGAKEQEWAQDWLRGRGLDDSPLMALFFGSKQPADIWPEDNVVQFLKQLVDTYPDARFLLFGGPHERAAANRLESNLVPELFQGRMFNLVGGTSLAQMAALMGHCGAMVSTDSGPMHVADALQVPMVALFSRHSYPPIWRPKVQPHVQLSVPVPCDHCLQSVCDRDNLCMASISPEAVLESLAGIWQPEETGARGAV